MLYAFSHSSISYALFRYALYTVVTHFSYANSVTRFIRRALRSYAVMQLRILYPTVFRYVTYFSTAVCNKINCSLLSVRVLSLK